MTEVTARRAVTRDRICDAAVEVFAARGVLGASVEEICEAAGFTRGAFYSNFDSKDALCAAVLERRVDSMLAAVDEIVTQLTPAEDLDIAEVIDLGISMFMAAQPSDPSLVLTMEELRLHAAREPAFRPTYQEQDQRATATVATSIEVALEQHDCQLITSGTEAIRLLHAVYDYGAIGSLIEPSEETAETRIVLLNQILRSLIEPRSTTRRRGVSSTSDR